MVVKQGCRSLIFVLMLFPLRRCLGFTLRRTIADPRTSLPASARPMCFSSVCVASRRGNSKIFLQANEDDDEFSVSHNNVEDYDLQPPYFNLRKESLLFDENAATRKNNNVRRLWESCQANLPRIVHGARPDNTTIDPLGAIYNMIFVRIPVILAGLFYVKNQVTGHPLIVDVGDGAFEMPPLVVAGVLYVLLR